MLTNRRGTISFIFQIELKFMGILFIGPSLVRILYNVLKTFFIHPNKRLHLFSLIHAVKHEHILIPHSLSCTINFCLEVKA